MSSTLERARAVAASVVDPELPAVTLGELGILRAVELDGEQVTVTITPTYSGCPAMAEMRADLTRRLNEAGFADVRVRSVLSPAWTSDWITDEGRRKLQAAGIVPPGPALLAIGTRRTQLCPQCGSPRTEVISNFSATACRALHRCLDCGEPFELFKAI